MQNQNYGSRCHAVKSSPMYKQQNNKRTLPEINTSSLPDIIFMLLFFFMVVTVIKKEDSQSEIKIPVVNYAELVTDKNNDAIIITNDQAAVSYKTGGQQYAQLSDLKKALTKQLANLRLARIKLIANSGIPMAEINAVKSLLQELELYEVDYLVMEK